VVRRILLAAASLAMLSACATSPQFYGWPTQAGTGTPPVIEAYYAPQSFAAGDTVKIFLRAKDPDRDMLYIACLPSETGYGPLDETEIPLTGNNRTEFAGYVSMLIPIFDPFEAAGINLSITILIRDQGGNASQPIQLSLTVSGSSGGAIPPQWQDAANHRLGDIPIDSSLFTNSGVQGSDRGND
jgi:hypothetical protein